MTAVVSTPRAARTTDTPVGAAGLPALALRDLSVRYGDRVALQPTTLDVQPRTIQGVVGPAGSGKTTLLRTLDLLSVEVDGATVSGSARLFGDDLLAAAGPNAGASARAALRRRVGIVFAVPAPLPGSIAENVGFGPRRLGVRGAALAERVERALRAARLWDEVKDRLSLPAMRLSGGQQQRLCLARTLAVEPEVLLLDEPCSGLDPISTAQIEDTLVALTRAPDARLTCVLVTNNVMQARRVADRTAFLLMGELVEEGPTAELFAGARDARTRDYLAGRFG